MDIFWIYLCSNYIPSLIVVILSLLYIILSLLNEITCQHCWLYFGTYAIYICVQHNNLSSAVYHFQGWRITCTRCLNLSTNFVHPSVETNVFLLWEWLQPLIFIFLTVEGYQGITIFPRCIRYFWILFSTNSPLFY